MAAEPCRQEAARVVHDGKEEQRKGTAGAMLGSHSERAFASGGYGSWARGGSQSDGYTMTWIFHFFV